MDEKSYDYILSHYMDKLENWKNFPKFIQDALLRKEQTTGSIYRPFNVDAQFFYKSLFLSSPNGDCLIKPLDFIMEKRNQLFCVPPEVFNMLYKEVKEEAFAVKYRKKPIVIEVLPLSHFSLVI